MAKQMKTILSNSAGKGDRRRVENTDKVRDNYDLIKKSCGCTFGQKCTCKR